MRRLLLALHKKSRTPSSLCNLCVLCVFVVNKFPAIHTTETQRTQRLHREIHNEGTFCAKPLLLLVLFLCASASAALPHIPTYAGASGSRQLNLLR